MITHGVITVNLFGRMRDIDLDASVKQVRTTQNPLLFLILGRPFSRSKSHEVTTTPQVPEHLISWITLLVMRGWAFILFYGVFLLLLASVAWQNPLTASGFWFDLLFARANGQPNGAHIATYLTIPIICFVAMFKFRSDPLGDTFLGLLTGAFFVAVHEGIWIIFYYAWYAQYLDISLWTNALKDVSFSSMIVLFIWTFTKYAPSKIPLRIFKWPVLVFVLYCAAWFTVPVFFGYNPMPITTLNNYKYGHTIYSVTGYWANPWVNGLEVFSWLGLFAMFVVVMVRAKYAH